MSEKIHRIPEMLRPLIKLTVGIIALIFIKILMAITLPTFDEGAPIGFTRIFFL